MSNKYPVGSQVWHIISRGRGAYRLGEVIKINEEIYHKGMIVRQPINKTTKFIYGYNETYHNCIPRAAVPDVPVGTIYIVDTHIGEMLGKRINTGGSFDVYECGTRAMSNGNLLGYVILPCPLIFADNHCQKPNYKTWRVGPSVYELLSFLGQKLPEVLEVSRSLLNDGKQKTEPIISSLQTT